MLDKESTLLIELCQEVCHVSYVEHDPEKYLLRYRSIIRALGSAFAYLGLATPTKLSPFGWKPTDELLVLIATRKTRHSKMSSKEAFKMEPFVFDLMLDTMFNDVHYYNMFREGTFCLDILHALGLVFVNTEKDHRVPSDLLCELFGFGYYIRNS